MAMQIQQHGENVVLSEIRLSIEKLAMSLNINLSDMQVLTLCEDVLDSYPYESIEDVRECLKNARRGVYGWGMLPRNSLTMMHVREWMAQHLERKAIEREKLHQAEKAKSKKVLEDVDYEAYKQRIKFHKKQEEDLTEKEAEFRDYKARYLAAQARKNQDNKE